ncbi:HXXEE domain-containing protein [Clostridium fungisolvens]|uniref:HXXEE domain-containing protein n=1 Tax=Clostridium fungisolvens TaxID=1604897 RepID=A0A6V8SF30_9CLOT|nr:HXXEE domain-containing protein [Clostridium fungisolvens]GFP75824.1 hypothetical protein bsdtw1_01916 [Clostridium fungisolvens]
MKDLSMIIWLFPIIFMLHDFEEIIMFNAWSKRNETKISSIAKGHIPFNFNASTAAFSFGVAEEFIIISFVTLFSSLSDNYLAWYGIFIAFTFHLILHFVQLFIFKKYIPATITSIILFPISIYMIYKVYILVNFAAISLIISILLSTIIMIANIFALHKLMSSVDCWLNRFMKI